MVTSGVLPESYSSHAKLNESPESSDDGPVFRRNRTRKPNRKSDRSKKGSLSQERRLAIEKVKSKKPNKQKSKPEEVQTISKAVHTKQNTFEAPKMEVLAPQNTWLTSHSLQEGKFCN